MERTTLELKGKKVFDIEVDGIDFSDYPDFVDAYISYAIYEDGTELTDEELDELTDQNTDYVQDYAYENCM